MAGLFDRQLQAEAYANGRPTYPSEWYSKIADLTPNRTLAWDVGTGNGQAAIGIAEHYEQVIATDVSKPQIEHGIPHPKVRYVHTPPSMSKDELASLVGGEGSVDLIIVAQAVHWFDFPSFYSLVNHVLRKPDGVIAVWGYRHVSVDPVFDPVMKRFNDIALPFFHPSIGYLEDSYRRLPFPFESVGIGSEGNPLLLDLPQETSLDGILNWLRSWSPVNTAKEKGVDLLSEDVVKEFEAAWGGPSDMKRTVIHKAFMIAGKPRI
ncbi:putative methyltransferase DDB_G0268948 [Telopea speciosissima]|uniref:putative methyltransferase DDB_G0268948 n=1 Tax=Telopea speciosissima TaxID=54955 RepID=UPI001CC6E705|nr:putative methyltransferase DDB_G0268948 [Telopea speciosissima]